MMQSNARWVQRSRCAWCDHDVNENAKEGITPTAKRDLFVDPQCARNLLGYLAIDFAIMIEPAGCVSSCCTLAASHRTHLFLSVSVFVSVSVFISVLVSVSVFVSVSVLVSVSVSVSVSVPVSVSSSPSLPSS
eukprot:238360-Rhodomonas_salina.1